MYGYDDYEEENYNKSVSFIERLKDKKILSIICTVFLVIVIIIIIRLFTGSNQKYHRLERVLVNAAREYVLNNNIIVNREIYIDVKKLNISLDDNCLLTSGVIYDGSEFFPNLMCDNYQSDVILNDKSITLNGDEVIVIPKGITYYDEGYESKNNISIIGEVGSESGVYNIHYLDSNNNTSVMRKVIIIEDNELNDLFPVITLNGSMNLSLKEFDSYNEEGASATDKIDGNITNKIKIEESVNTGKKGIYKVRYSVINSKGYKRVVVRDVYVGVNSDKVISYLNTNNSGTVTINLTINDDNFDYIELPNGESKYDKNIVYEVTSNGKYKFIIHDKNGDAYEKEVLVNSINNINSNSTCTATLRSDRTEIVVNIDNSINISNYEYIVNNKTETISASKIFNSKSIKPESVSVKVKTSSGIVNEIKCNLEEKLVPQIVTDSRGKNCLEGHICYVQYDYQDSKYPFCSMNPETTPNSCGGIGRNGCSITSASIAIANLGVRSPSGEVYNPYTVWEYLYPFYDKSIGACWGGCSGWTRVRDSIINAGLSAPVHYANLSANNFDEIINH